MTRKIRWEICRGWPDNPKWIQGETRIITAFFTGEPYFKMRSDEGPSMTIVLPDARSDLTELFDKKGVKVGRLTEGFNCKRVAFLGPDDVPTNWEWRGTRTMVKTQASNQKVKENV